MNYIINTDAKILVIGDLMLDHYIYGICNRISPEAPVPVVEVNSESYTLGGAGNVIKNLKALGCTANIISIVGDDDNALIVKKQLSEAHVNDHNLIKDSKRCTTIKSRVLVSNHQLIRLDKEDIQPINEIVLHQLKAIIEREIKGNDLVLISDYNKGLLSPQLLAHIFAVCKVTGIKTIIDPKGADFSKYYGANIIKPNKKEAGLATGINIVDESSLKNACIKIKEITNCDSVVVTMSEDGIASYADGKLDIIATRALGVIDVTGAGDTVLATLGVALASGKSLHDSCDLANHAAAIVVSKVGSATASMDEINEKRN